MKKIKTKFKNDTNDHWNVYSQFLNVSFLEF